MAKPQRKLGERVLVTSDEHGRLVVGVPPGVRVLRVTDPPVERAVAAAKKLDGRAERDYRCQWRDAGGHRCKLKSRGPRFSYRCLRHDRLRSGRQRKGKK